MVKINAAVTASFVVIISATAKLNETVTLPFSDSYTFDVIQFVTFCKYCYILGLLIIILPLLNSVLL